VLDAVARSVGSKFVYARVGEGIKDQQARPALEPLAQARVIHLVTHTAANGVPLGGEAKDRVRKAVLADVGMLRALLETPAASAHPAWSTFAPQVRGQLVEQLAAQQIRLLDDGVGDGPRLFHWHRDGGRPGEIDHVIHADGTVVPIELKAGAAGSMKSLHQFMADEALGVAVRLDANPPSLQTVSVTTTHGTPVTFRLLALPHYLAWSIRRALEQLPAA
jgi:hypothetical protein